MTVLADQRFDDVKDHPAGYQVLHNRAAVQHGIPVLVGVVGPTEFDVWLGKQSVYVGPKCIGLGG